ncbi:MAG: GntR family transcriptional regulator [Rhodobiaceae bacterium]|nr:GntR family transcriptional regulator [Rhodobiaceae bacterium]MCC0014129.1 GntR family transcriptional regulator [Rhodobiaceae bacterium]MCC0051738.1 GntR family transcriptional regulator [Rhodobiaceae bacterium]MCC0060467.1 GntR family transcriptional regulator [Rhodobiaceae bacterium]
MSFAEQARPIERRTLYDELVERVRGLVVEGALQPGEKIPERELCERFGVSRTPLREALKVLASDGLVQLTPNRGATVARLTVEDLEDVFPVMGALEALAGELACHNITDEQIAEIQDVHRKMVACYEARMLPEYFQLNQRIHELILEAAGNRTLSAQYSSLAQRIRRARFMANASDARWKQAVSEHEEIISALESRNGEALASILKLHLNNKFHSVRKWLISQENGTRKG